VVFYTFIQMAAAREMDLSKVVPASQLALAQQQVNVYWSAAWPLTLLGAVERIFTIPCQIAFSVLVLQAFTRKQLQWIALAVLWHAFLDASVVYLSAQWSATTWGVYAVEGLVGLFALISIGFIFALRRPEPPEPEEILLPPAPLLDVGKVVIKDTQENIEDSRYM
jgi:uncharacterized membrane protein YhfC